MKWDTSDEVGINLQAEIRADARAYRIANPRYATKPRGETVWNVCRNCGAKPMALRRRLRKGRCAACRAHYDRTGEERPLGGAA